MVVNGRPLKRMKRRITADLNDFLTFPASNDEFSGHYDRPFRSNVQNFLYKHAQLPPPSSLFPHLLIWQIVLRIGELTDGTDSSPAVVTLDVVEEDVTRSRSVYCDQCRVVGWSGHPVCGKRYHFIIRTGDSSIEGYHKSCPNYGDLLHLSESSCKSCNYVVSSEELEEWVHLQLESTTHLLHGVVHGNGYGHLLRVNGKEGGSKFLSGCDIMNFWDRLCATLRVRKISVMDVSKKYGMEYRLLHAVTNGHPWYGDWGYEFGSGSFALTLDAYQKAVEDLSNIPLSVFFSQARRNTRTHLQDIISFYQSLSDCELLTMRDLFCFLMRRIRQDLSSSPANCDKKPGSFSSWTLCAWTIDDVNRVEQGIIKVLQAVGGYIWVSWRSLKGALCRTASPQLLDYCLKRLGGKIVCDSMVQARYNTERNAFEYRLVPNCGILSDEDELMNCPTVDQLIRDLKFLYDSLLNPQTMINYRPNKTRECAVCSAARLLDCKQFVKDYKPEEIAVKNPYVVRLSCEVELLDHPKDYTAPPSELILLPYNSTVTDAKTEATKAFQEVYVIFKRFQVEDVIHYPSKESTSLNILPGTTGSVRVRGRCHEKHGLDQFRMERGTENWTVNCSCGTKDDDGERMLACDSCGVWQHTRCAGINDIDAVPESFICGKCSGSSKKEALKVVPNETGRRACKEMGGYVTGDSCRIGTKELIVPFGVS